MKRTIVGFRRDDRGDWVAELECGHGQHVRHRPPFENRAWVLDPGRRAAMIGKPRECPLCDVCLSANREAELMDESVYDHDIVIALAATQVLLARLELGDASKVLAGGDLIEDLRRFQTRLEERLTELSADR